VQRRSPYKTLLALSVLVFLLQILTPSPMMAGFKARMSQLDEAQFDALADAIHEVAATGDSRGDLFGSQHHLDALMDTHPALRASPILQASSWGLPKAYANSQVVQIRWGSGLTGALAVEIWREGTEPSVPADATDSTPVYPRVQLLHIP
jgi:hypothetical protein